MEFDERRYRPLSTVDLYDEAFDLYKRNFVLLLSIVAIIVVPSTILVDLFTTKWLNALIGQINANASASPDATQLLQTFIEMMRQTAIAAVVYVPAWTLVWAAMTAAVSARYLEKPITLAESYVQAARRYISALISTICFLAILASGSLIISLSVLEPDWAPLFIVVGSLVELVTSLFIFSCFPVYMGAVVAERLGPFQALKRSLVLTKSDSGRILSALFSLFVISVFISAGIEGTLELLAGQIVSSSYVVVPAIEQNKYLAAQIAGGLTNLLLTPFDIVVVTLLYYNQRIRKEGYDMDVLADRLGYRPLSALNLAAYSPALSVKKVKRAGRK